MGKLFDDFWIQNHESKVESEVESKVKSKVESKVESEIFAGGLTDRVDRTGGKKRPRGAKLRDRTMGPSPQGR